MYNYIYSINNNTYKLYYNNNIEEIYCKYPTSNNILLGDFNSPNITWS